MHPFPSYKTNNSDLWNWKTGMGAEYYTTPFAFYEFSLSKLFNRN